MKKELKDLLSHIEFSEDEINAILSSFSPLTIRKGEYFSESDKICSNLGILLNGLLYAKFISKNGDIIASRFFYHTKDSLIMQPSIIVTSFESFKLKTPSIETIEALEDSILWVISRDNLEKLCMEYNSINAFVRELSEYSYIQTLKRVHTLLTLKCEERFELFYHESPELLKKVQINILASYLGMTRNVFSRIRKAHLK